MILFFVLIYTSVSPLGFKVVKASGTIYIMADGSIDPPAAPIQRSDNTYTFTNDIYEPIVVKRDYIIIDGAGFTVQGAGSGKGIDISKRNNVTIKNIKIRTFDTGVYLYQSSSNMIIGNNITNSTLGIKLDYYSSFNIISGNSITENRQGIAVGPLSSNNEIYGNYLNNLRYLGIFIETNSNNNNILENNITNSSAGIRLVGYSNHNNIVANNITTDVVGIQLRSSSNNSILRNTFSNGGLRVDDSYENSVENNSINGKPLVYLESASNYTVDNAGQVILVNCHDIVVQNLNLSQAGVGIELEGTNYTKISNNNITNNSNIELLHSSNNRIYGNNMTNNGECVELLSSSNNSIFGNSITSNVNGLHFAYDSNYNIVWGNDIVGNIRHGVFLERSGNNSIFHNNFAENQKHVSTVAVYGNLWDDSVEGNFWSNYTGVDDDQDGIGDSSHVIDAENQDIHPLMGRFSSFNTSKGSLVNIVSNSSIEDFRYFQSNSTIRMQVSNTTANQTFGFCRVCIPHALINETYRVTVNDAEPYKVNYTLYDDGSNRWIYFSYRHSTLEIVIIPEFLWLIPSLLIATIPILVIIRRRKHSA
jgi:parallel beta-helix repeat protein